MAVVVVVESLRKYELVNLFFEAFTRTGSFQSFQSSLVSDSPLASAISIDYSLTRTRALLEFLARTVLLLNDYLLTCFAF